MIENLELARTYTDNEKRVTASPFPIRGHHLEIFRELASGISPEESVNNHKKYFDRRLNSTYPVTTQNNPNAGLGYVYDVIGKTTLEREENNQQLLKVLEEFISLPSDHPVKLLSKKKDKICDSCVVGKHCTMNAQYTDVVKTTDDQVYLDVFAEIAKSMGLENEFYIGEETAIFSDTPDETVKFITTTAGTLLQVLNHEDFKKQVLLKNCDFVIKDIETRRKTKPFKSI